MTKKKYRRYSPEFKRHTLKRASEDGVTDKGVCEELGISARQLRRWRDQYRLLGDEAFPGQGKNRDEELTKLKRELALLQAVFKKGVRWGDVSVSPVVKIERFKEHPRKRYVQDWEFDAFKSYAGQLIAAYMDFQYLTALRQGDILRVHLNEIKDDGIHVTISKTGKERIITWTPTLRAAVRDARMLPRPVRGMYLFCTRTGSRYTTDGFRSIWHRKMRSALEVGVLRERFTTHDIRAKSASDANDLERAQDLLGHANNKVTREYYRRLPELVKPLK